MSERELNRAVARLCGEAVDLIQTYGFRMDEDAPQAESNEPLVIDWDDRSPAYLDQVLSDDDWPGRTSPLPSWDEEFDDVFIEELIGAAA